MSDDKKEKLRGLKDGEVDIHDLDTRAFEMIRENFEKEYGSINSLDTTDNVLKQRSMAIEKLKKCNKKNQKHLLFAGLSIGTFIAANWFDEEIKEIIDEKVEHDFFNSLLKCSVDAIKIYGIANAVFESTYFTINAVTDTNIYGIEIANSEYDMQLHKNLLLIDEIYDNIGVMNEKINKRIDILQMCENKKKENNIE